MVPKEAKTLAASAFKNFNASVPLASLLSYTCRLLPLKGPSSLRVAALCPDALLIDIHHSASIFLYEFCPWSLYIILTY